MHMIRNPTSALKGLVTLAPHAVRWLGGQFSWVGCVILAPAAGRECGVPRLREDKCETRRRAYQESAFLFGPFRQWNRGRPLRDPMREPWCANHSESQGGRF